MMDISALQFDILTVLASGRRHGYALIEDIAGLSGRRPGVATVYAALRKLEQAELVQAVGDDIVDGRLRRYFALTQHGASELAQQAQKMVLRAETAITSLGLSGATA